MTRRNMIFSLEDEKVGTSKETEIVIYARIGDHHGLNNADSFLVQKQLESHIQNKIPCRVRANTVGEQTTYTFTYKLAGKEDSGIETKIEHSYPVTEEFYKGFTNIAERFINKTRYIYTAKNVILTYELEGTRYNIAMPSIVYEVDVYKDVHGTDCNWCKIDVEIDKLLEHLKAKHPDMPPAKINIKLNHLPFKPMEAIFESSASPEDHSFIQNLWDKFFVLPIEHAESSL